MKLKLEINMDNAAFQDDAGGEASRILKDAVIAVSKGCIRSLLFDINGNVVGSFSITGRSHATKDKRGSYPRGKR